jgi:hypothetical protein
MPKEPFEAASKGIAWFEAEQHYTISLLNIAEEAANESRAPFINPNKVLVKLNPDHNTGEKSAIGYDLIRRRG